MSLLTIITPSKNHLEGLRQATESIPPQTLRDWDHLVIDGASIDGTVDYCQGRPQTRIISEPDNCVEAALSKGLRLAQGKYVTFLLCYDAFVDPNWLKESVDFLDQNPDYSMITGTAGTDAYPYEAYPNDEKFNYYFFIAPWTMINETAFVIRTDVARRLFPDFQSANHRQDVFFHLWLNFFTQGYLTRLVPRKVVQNDTHAGSRIAAEAEDGRFGAKVADFYDTKRRTRHELMTGKFRLEFKTPEGKKARPTYRRSAFVLANLAYKWNLFFLKKILRRKLPKTRYGYTLDLGKHCVDRFVRS